MATSPVTTAGQKNEIPEDPSQTLPGRSRMDPILQNFVFEKFQNFGKNRSLVVILANIGLRISQADLGLDAV